MMEARYNSFIGMYDGVFPDGYCRHMIDEFERLNSRGVCSTRKQSENAKKTIKDDTHCFLNMKNVNVTNFNDKCSESILWDGLQKCFNDYVDEYDILKDVDLRCTHLKVQKTDPGSGYHVWHSEQGNSDSNNRCLVYSVYLNTLDEDGAGETEFLYQQLRIPPKENTVIIWPAAFTHAHRGNVVYGNTSKYIITGWFYLD